MKKYKEIGYGLGIFLLHVLFGIASKQIGIFAISGLILSVLTTYVLCKLK